MFRNKAIKNINNTSCYLDGKLIVLKGNVPTEQEIQDEIVRLEAEYDSLEYARKRKAEYDKLNQDEMRFDDLINGTTTWQDAILAIKAKYPKPTKG